MKYALSSVMLVLLPIVAHGAPVRPRASRRHRLAAHEYHALLGDRGDQLVVLAVLRGAARAVARSLMRSSTAAAYASFPREIRHPPRSFAEQVFNIERWTEMPRGGHFAALEAPELLAADVTTFFPALRGR
jgi:pimeloyl-ACP methyl ester carboxylesterase